MATVIYEVTRDELMEDINGLLDDYDPEVVAELVDRLADMDISANDINPTTLIGMTDEQLLNLHVAACSVRNVIPYRGFSVNKCVVRNAEG